MCLDVNILLAERISSATMKTGRVDSVAWMIDSIVGVLPEEIAVQQFNKHIESGQLVGRANSNL